MTGAYERYSTLLKGNILLGGATDVTVFLVITVVVLGVAAWIGFATPDGVVKAATGSTLEGASVVDQPWFRAGRVGIIAKDVQDVTFNPLTRDETRFVDIAAPVRCDATSAPAA